MPLRLAQIALHESVAFDGDDRSRWGMYVHAGRTWRARARSADGDEEARTASDGMGEGENVGMPPMLRELLPVGCWLCPECRQHREVKTS